MSLSASSFAGALMPWFIGSVACMDAEELVWLKLAAKFRHVQPTCVWRHQSCQCKNHWHLLGCDFEWESVVCCGRKLSHTHPHIPTRHHQIPTGVGECGNLWFAVVAFSWRSSILMTYMDMFLTRSFRACFIAFDGFRK